MTGSWTVAGCRQRVIHATRPKGDIQHVSYPPYIICLTTYEMQWSLEFAKVEIVWYLGLFSRRRDGARARTHLSMTMRPSDSVERRLNSPGYEAATYASAEHPLGPNCDAESVPRARSSRRAGCLD